mgnify:CR=1 FL=1
MQNSEFNNYYFKHTMGQTYDPISINSLPFPPSEIPEIIETNEYFIEEFSSSAMLRHIENPYLCIPILDGRKEIELPSEMGTLTTYYLTVFYVYFEGTPYSVGYSFGKENNFETFYFLERQHCNGWEELAQMETIFRSKAHLRLAYESGLLTTETNLKQSSDRTRQFKFAKYLHDRNLTPKGEWEKQVFRDNFGNNPFVLTDDEFEMIFGESK